MWSIQNSQFPEIIYHTIDRQTFVKYVYNLLVIINFINYQDEIKCLLFSFNPDSELSFTHQNYPYTQIRLPRYLRIERRVAKKNPRKGCLLWVFSTQEEAKEYERRPEGQRNNPFSSRALIFDETR